MAGDRVRPRKDQQRGSRINHRAVVDRAWAELDDPRVITEVHEISANVSTNRVYRVHLDDGSRLVTKVSNYGSYFLFAEDHDRIHRWHQTLQTTRYRNFLAESVTRHGRAWTYYDTDVWAVFYTDVERRDSLPKVLSMEQLQNLGDEMALFHLQSSAVASRIPLTSKSVKSDAIHLLDLLTNPFSAAKFRLDEDQVATARHHTLAFLRRLLTLDYDDMPKIPILIDWNLGNFSVEPHGNRFRLFSRWDYDWFRIEPRAFDFYFLSRVSSATGDRTQFTYGPHTLVEPTFIEFLKAYHDTSPLSEAEIDLIAEGYRFFLLNYVLREGDAFFNRDLSQKFVRDAVNLYLPAFESLDMTPVKDALSP